MDTMQPTKPPEDAIILRQSWLGDLAMCPERARQVREGVAISTDSSNTVLGSAVHYGIEQCLIDKMDTGVPMSKADTLDAAMQYWQSHIKDIVRWNHKEGEPEKIIEANSNVWWDEVMPDIHPVAVEYEFCLPLVPQHTPEIWLKGTIDCIQEAPLPILDWKNPGRKPSAEWEKKRWSVQAAAYTWAVQAMEPQGFGQAQNFEFVYLVKGVVHRTYLELGPADWAGLVALAHSAGTQIAANLPEWPLHMSGWHCSPKWCPAWNSCRGRYAGPDPWDQL